MASPAIPIHPRTPDDPPSMTTTVVPTGAATSMTGAATSPILNPEAIASIGNVVKAAMGDGGGTSKQPGTLYLVTLLAIGGLWVHSEVNAARTDSAAALTASGQIKEAVAAARADSAAALAAVASIDERVKGVEKISASTAEQVERNSSDTRRNTALLEFLAERLLPGIPIPRNNP